MKYIDPSKPATFFGGPTVTNVMLVIAFGYAAWNIGKKLMK